MSNCRNTHDINVSQNIHSVPAHRILSHVTAFNKNIFIQHLRISAKTVNMIFKRHEETHFHRMSINSTEGHDDVIKWKHFPRYRPFVQGIHRSPVNSPHKGHWRGAMMVSLICVWINGWVNNREAGDLRCYRAYYDVIVMSCHSQQAWELHSNKHCGVIDRNLTADWINQGDAMKTSGLQDKAGMMNRAKTGIKWNIGQYFTNIMGILFSVTIIGNITIIREGW